MEDMIPKGLDEIIRLNRDKASIRHATDEDLGELVFLKSLTVGFRNTPFKFLLKDWHLVCVEITDSKQKTICALGYVHIDGRDRTWITSSITSIDIDAGYFETHSGSFYKLDLNTKGEGEPDFDQLALLCVRLHQQGAGEALGVPRFFY